MPSAFSDFSVHMIRECGALEELVLPDNLAVFHCQWSPREFSIFETTPKLKFNEYKNALYLGNENNPYIALISVLDKKVEEFTIHKDVKAIVNNVFEQCRFLKEISIPVGVKYIYEKTFFENPKSFNYFLVVYILLSRIYQHLGICKVYIRIRHQAFETYYCNTG